jgi:hypothetical protein
MVGRSGRSPSSEPFGLVVTRICERPLVALGGTLDTLCM